MLTQSSKRSTLLAAIVLAACALAGPSMAAAASWGTVGTTHTLDSDNLGWATNNHATTYASSWTCLATQLHVDVRSASALAVTGANFKTCSSLNRGGSCTVTMTPARFPWTVTGTGTTDVRIDGVHIGIQYEDLPGAPGTCGGPYANQQFTLTGSIGTASGQGIWGASTHQISFVNAMGLTAHSLSNPALTHTVRVMGTLRDTTQSLTLT
jgi:hypothetical protein